MTNTFVEITKSVNIPLYAVFSKVEESPLIMITAIVSKYTMNKILKVSIKIITIIISISNCTLVFIANVGSILGTSGSLLAFQEFMVSSIFVLNEGSLYAQNIRVITVKALEANINIFVIISANNMVNI